MKRYFVCLANSKKYSGRCVAGIELLPRVGKGKRYQLRHVGERPAWIRPISGDEFGQIDEGLVANLNLLDIVEIEVIQDFPEGYQSENVLFDPNSIQVLEIAPVHPDLLDKLVNPLELQVFGNSDNAIPVEDISRLDYSLTLIKPDQWRCYHKLYKEKSQTRIEFTHNGDNYDFPVTDLTFLEEIKSDPYLIEEVDTLYLTISLGLEFRGSHYKLIAGVICCD
jgi:hypothetical protein